MKKFAIVIVLCLPFLAFFTCTPPRAPNNTVFRFVVLGDSRGDYKADPPVYLNETVLDSIAQNILALSPPPAFVIFNGDMVAKSAYPDSDNSPDSINEWKSIFYTPIDQAGINVYMIPGNHIIDQPEVTDDDPMKYISLFRDTYQNDNPNNGPLNFSGTSYSFTYENCHFTTVSSFMTHKGDDNNNELTNDTFIQPTKTWEYFVNEVNRNWLIDDLANDDSSFTIFFTHIPLYSVGPHASDLKSFDAHPTNRDALATILDNANVDIYFGAHEHLYSRATLSAENPGNSTLTNSMVQIVAGAVGAPFSPTDATADFTMDKYEDTNHFVVGDVKLTSINYTVIDENNTIIDNFSINKK